MRAMALTGIAARSLDKLGMTGGGLGMTGGGARDDPELGATAGYQVMLGLSKHLARAVLSVNAAWRPEDLRLDPSPCDELMACGTRARMVCVRS
jgi:hypothetical protein